MNLIASHLMGFSEKNFGYGIRKGSDQEASR